ncbi:hypothetical protein Hanom_Chr03g00213211 [Helianthus anomalus]
MIWFGFPLSKFWNWGKFIAGNSYNHASVFKWFPDHKLIALRTSVRWSGGWGYESTHGVRASCR